MPKCLKKRDDGPIKRVSKCKSDEIIDDEIPEMCLIWFDGKDDWLCVMGEKTSNQTDLTDNEGSDEEV